MVNKDHNPRYDATVIEQLGHQVTSIPKKEPIHHTAHHFLSKLLKYLILYTDAQTNIQKSIHIRILRLINRYVIKYHIFQIIKGILEKYVDIHKNNIVDINQVNMDIEFVNTFFKLVKNNFIIISGIK